MKYLICLLEILAIGLWVIYGNKVWYFRILGILTIIVLFQLLHEVFDERK